MNKLDELKDLITALQKKEEEKQKNTVLLVLAVLGAVAAVAGIAYAVYRYFTPDYLDDFDDDLDDDFDNYFDDEDEEDKETEEKQRAPFLDSQKNNPDRRFAVSLLYHRRNVPPILAAPGGESILRKQLCRGGFLWGREFRGPGRYSGDQRASARRENPPDFQGEKFLDFNHL